MRTLDVVLLVRIRTVRGMDMDLRPPSRPTLAYARAKAEKERTAVATRSAGFIGPGPTLVRRDRASLVEKFGDLSCNPAPAQIDGDHPSLTVN